MDKYEYRIRAEEINELIERKEYIEAVKIADTIDWRRVRSVVMLCKVSELYKMNRRYEDSKEVLLLAYDLQPNSRKIVYSLCELSIKLEETVQAVEYYKEFIHIAPKDTGRFILQYRLYEAQDVSLEERIAVLEEYKKRDYREKWAYELAYLYHRIGLATRCVEECDELILWFGEGKYVIKALELKMLHAPLTPLQQEKYNARFATEEEVASEVTETVAAEDGVEPSLPIEIKAIEPTRAKTEEIPARQVYEEAMEQEEIPVITPESTKEIPNIPYDVMTGYVQQEAVQEVEMEEPAMEEMVSSEPALEETSQEEISLEEPEAEEEDSTEAVSEELSEDEDMKIINPAKDLDIQVKTIDVGDAYNTINLQEELAKNLAEILAQEDMEAADATKALPVDSIFQAATIASTLEKAKKDIPEAVAAVEEITEISVPEEKESAVETATEEEEAQEPIAAAEEEETQEPIAAAEEEEAEEPVAAAEEEEAEEPVAIVEEEETPEPVAAAEEEETLEPVAIVEEEETPEPVAAAEEEETLEPIAAAEEEETLEPIAAAEEEEAEEPVAIAEEEETLEPIAAAEEEEAEEPIAIAAEEEAEELVAIAEEEETLEPIATAEEEEAEEPIPVAQEMKVEELLAAAEEAKAVAEEKKAEEFQAEEVVEEVPEAATEEATEKTVAEAVEEIAEVGTEKPETILEEIKPEAEESNEELEEIEETEEIEEIEPLFFSKNEPLPEAFIQAVQSVAMEAAKEAARQAAHATVEAMKEIQPEASVPVTEGLSENEKPEEVALQQEKEPDPQVENQITGQLSFDDIMAEWEETKKANEDKHLQEMKQRVLEQTGPLFSEFDATARKSSETSLDMLSPMLDVFSGTDGLATEVENALAEEETAATYETPVVEPEPEVEPESEVEPEPELIAPAEEETPVTYEEPTAVADPITSAEEETPVTYEEPTAVADPITSAEEETPVIYEEPAPAVEETADTYNILSDNPVTPVAETSTEIEDRPNSFNTEEINGLEDKLLDALGNQHYETANISVPIPVEKEEIVPRVLTKEEKEYFGCMAQTKEIQEQVAYALDSISLVPTTGNVIVTGEKGTGALKIAQNVAAYLSKTRRDFTGNSITYTSKELAETNVVSIINEVVNGALIIDNAGDLSANLCESLIKAARELSEGGIVFIFTDTQSDIERLVRSYQNITEYFDVRIDITTLDNDGLVNFGKEYAKEKEYSIDDMGVLALYNRIEEGQTSVHAVTVDEVKDLVNEAIIKAEKKNLSHFMDVIFAKRYDKDDMVVLREKDFVKE